MAYSITTFESDHIGVVVIKNLFRMILNLIIMEKEWLPVVWMVKFIFSKLLMIMQKKFLRYQGIIYLYSHNGAVWQLSWSHPEFGSLIASCGFDRKVYIWKETANNKWEKTYEYTDHKNSVNSVSFCPHEYGLILLCSSLDGSISIHEYKSINIYNKDENWSAVKITAHSFGVTSSTWACNDLNTSLRFISAGVDGLIKIWSTKENNFGHNINSFTIDSVLEGHEDSIKEISWKYNSEAGYEVIVSGGEVWVY